MKNKTIKFVLFAFTLLLLLAVMGLRAFDSYMSSMEAAFLVPSSVVDTGLAEVEATPVPTPTPSAPEPEPEPKVEPTPEPPAYPGPAQAYTAKTYALVSDIAYICREIGVKTGSARLEPVFAALETEDPAMATLWRDISNYVAKAAGDGFVMESLHTDLPQNESLAIVVLGFQLNADGTMPPELLARCETALAAAEQYPKAYLCLTGGGTAAANREATEADVMGDWFISQGVDSARIIIENRSLTTDQNAAFCCDIFAESYPQIKNVVLVSSDYHVPLGCTMFAQAAMLHAWENNSALPYTVVANLACETAGDSAYSGEKNIMRYVWTMAAPEY